MTCWPINNAMLELILTEVKFDKCLNDVRIDKNEILFIDCLNLILFISVINLEILLIDFFLIKDIC